MSRIDDLYTTARRAFERGDAASWEAAEAMAELANRGQTQRQIAERVGCSQPIVSWSIRAVVDNPVINNRPPFQEAVAAIRGERNHGTRVPKAPEKRAELAAELLKDKAVADAPQVRQVQERHADRRLRAEAAAANRAAGIPTRTEEAREDRRTSTLENKIFWRDVVAKMQNATRALNEAATELERSGLPRSGSGEIIRAARTLARAAERLAENAAEAGIGRAM